MRPAEAARPPFAGEAVIDHSTHLPSTGVERRVAILVDCDNTSPGILEYVSRVASQLGRVVVRRGYGNAATLGHRWQEALVRLAFAPLLQYQYAAGKNSTDIALALDALEALFDRRAETFCLVTSDSDFTTLCRKLRERDATVCIVGEAKTPDALRHACDRFFEWRPTASAAPAASKQAAPAPAKRQPTSIVTAIESLAAETSARRVGLSGLGQYLKRSDPTFTVKAHGHASLLKMVKAHPELSAVQEGGAWYVGLRT